MKFIVQLSFREAASAHGACGFAVRNEADAHKICVRESNAEKGSTI